MIYGVVPLLREHHPLWTVGLCYLVWKTILLGIAVTNPGVGYDSSTGLLAFSARLQKHDELLQPNRLANFVRWDAIYYTQIAQRGHLFEQEWAFGIGLSTILRAVAGLLFTNPRLDVRQLVIAGILTSHLTGLGSTILVWLLSHQVTRGSQHEKDAIASAAACLYIISPAGIFLSAPYSESPFAFANLLGFYLYSNARQQMGQRNTYYACMCCIVSGAAFGLATLIRSNGILSGTLFAIDTLLAGYSMLRSGFDRALILRIVSLIIGGTLIFFGISGPQYLAYQEYCGTKRASKRRAWCNSLFPSVFAFVQSFYWNVGPFRYWTLSNVPLFLLAAPTLCLLMVSAVQLLRNLRQPNGKKFHSSEGGMAVMLAIPQFLLAAAALTSYHVQIINRLSSGYPLWYIWLAEKMTKSPHPSKFKIITRWMSLYALIQAGLYAAFLPPA